MLQITEKILFDLLRVKKYSTFNYLLANGKPYLLSRNALLVIKTVPGF